MKDSLVFDVTDADTRAESDNVGAYLRAGTDGDLISSGDGSSDDVGTGFEGLDARAFGYAFDGTNWDRLRATAGALHVDIQDASIDVDLDHTTDSIRLGDGTTLTTVTTVGADNGLDVNIINASVTVDATDLDIRSLDHTSGGTNDSVRLGDGTSFLTSTTVGSDIGLDVYAINDPATANTAITNNAKSVGVTATDLLGTDLANRKYAFLYNNSNRRLFVGGSSVTLANGFPVSPGSYVEFKAGANIDLHAISPVASKEMRILELS